MFGFQFTSWTIPNVCLRIFVSLILGSLIGLDRGIKRRGAGAKTSTVVCLGSTLVMLTGQYMSLAFPGQVDLTRMAAQVISGVGFLGVGTIIVSGHQVRGLTTAASLWTCACVGLSVGIGFLDGSILVTVCMLFALHVLPAIERHVYHRSRYVALYIEVENNQVVSPFLDTMHKHSIRVESLDIVKGKGKNVSYSLQVMLHLPTPFQSSYLEMIEKIDGVVSVDVI
ncbi:MAG: MgtC/SapB family protein [Lachnospiraceae bacterium]